jgi:hypothetical protein
MTSSSLSENTLTALLKAGWYPDRSIDTSQYQPIWRRNGLSWIENATRIFAEFGGIDLTHVTPDPDTGELEQDDDSVNIFLAYYIRPQNSNLLHQEIARLEIIKGEPFCFLGNLCTGYAFLLINESGNIYAWFNPNINEKSFIYIGKDIYSAIENVFSGKWSLGLAANT